MKTGFPFQSINKSKPAARLLLASAIGLACLPASADDKAWLGADGNYWGNPANWSGGLPSAADNAYLDNPAAAVVGANASAGNVYVGDTGTGWLAVGGDNGATLTVSGSVVLGAAAAGHGTLLLARAGNLVTNSIVAGQGTSALLSDGGFVTALSNNDNFFNGITALFITATHANIGGSNSGLTFNTSGFAVTATSNVSFTSAGAKTTRGFAKTGAGVLTLTGSINLAAGRVDVAGGELALGGTLSATHAQNMIGFDTSQSGTLRVLAGGSVYFGGALIGDRAGANGVLVLETGASYYASGTTIIGNTAGVGVVTIKSGAALNSARNYLGGGISSGTGTGVVVVEDGGVFITRGRLDIGTLGSGTLRLIDSATVMATGIVLGRSAGGSGVIEITGTRGASITGTNGSSSVFVNQDSAAAGGIVRFMHSDTNYITSLSLRNLTRLEHTGPGLTALTSANSHTLGTLISAGTLQVGNNTTSGALAGDVENNATLAVYRSNDYDFAANISGTGVLVKKGSARLTLTGTNTYTGGNIVEAGTLAGTLDTIRGDVALTSTGATLEINVASGSGTLASSVTGSGNFVKTGAGFLLLGSAVDYTGNTTVGAGTLKGRIGAGALDVAADATYVVADGAQDATLANLTGSGTVNLNNASLVFGVAGGTQTYGFTGALTGGRDLRKTGDGLLDLGAHALASSFSGTTFVEGGTLRLDSVAQITGGLVLGSAGAVGLIEQTSGALTQALTLAGQGGGISVSGGTQTFAEAVNGAGDFAKGGDGTLDVRGAIMNQSGGTRILGGTLLGDADVIKGDITLANGATVEFAQNTSGTVAGLVTGSGHLVMNGTGELTLANNANSYTGDTTVNSGTLKGTVGAGTLTVAAGATYKVADGVTEASLANITGDGAVDLNAASLRLVAAAGVTSTFSYNNLVSSNTASRLVKSGAGRVVLDTPVTLGGGAAVEDGVLEIDSLSKVSAPVALGTGSTYGLIGYTDAGAAWTHAVTLNGRGGGFSVDAASGTVTLAATATIGGAGDFYKSGSGALDLTAAAMNNTGGTRVLGGTLIGDTATIKGDADIAAGATLRFRQASTGTFAGTITGAGALHKTGAGALVLGSALNAYGDTIIDEGVLTGAIGAGTLTVNTGGTYRVTDGVTEFELEGIAGAGTVDLNAANLTFNVASGTAQFSFTGSLAGGNRFIKAGAGALELLSSVALAQGASIRDGVVRLADQSFINAPVELGSASSYGLIEYTNEGVAWTRALALAGQGGGFSVGEGKTIALAAATTISGAGDFRKAGAGTLDITAATMNGTGVVLVAGGTLRGGTATIKNDASVGAGAVIEFFENGSAAHAHAVNGSGALAKSGTGALTLTGANTHAGGNRVLAGELIGGVASLPGDAVVESGARIIIEQAGDSTYAGNVSGAGVFAKRGGGALTLGGTHAHTGGSVFESGTVIGGADNLRGSIANDAVVIYTQHSGTSMFADVITGAGSFAKTGAGELVVAASAVVSQANVVIAEGSLRLLGDITAGTFGNGGVLRVGHPAGDGARSHVTIHGDYTAADGAVAWFGLAGDGGAIAADTLRIIGAADGRTEVRFDYAGALPAGETLPTDIVVVEGGGAAGSFFQNKNNGVRLDDGGYVIWQQNADAGTGGHWVNAVAPEVSALGGMDAASILIGKASLDSLGRRLTVARAVEPRRGMTLWLSGLYRRDEIGGGIYDWAKADTGGVQIGGDWTFGGDGRALTLGVFYDYAKTDMDLKDSASSSTTEGHGAGVYGTFKTGPWHVNAIVRGSREDYSVTVPGVGGMDTDGDSLAGSIEIGYEVPIEYGWTAEPQAQFTYQHHGISDTADPYGRAIRIDSASSAELRAGVRFWREYTWRRGLVIRPYGRASYLYDFKGRSRIEIFDTAFRNSIGGGAGLVDGGAEMQLGRGFAINAGLSWYFGGKVTGCGGNAGLSYAW